VDDAKLSQYLTAGTVRKSRREKEQEAAEAKKREEEASAAKAYAEFLDTFDADHSARKSASNFVKADSKSAYVPASRDFAPGLSRSSGKARVSITPSWCVYLALKSVACPVPFSCRKCAKTKGKARDGCFPRGN
jgi:U2-associated protein SR140